VMATQAWHNLCSKMQICPHKMYKVKIRQRAASFKGGYTINSNIVRLRARQPHLIHHSIPYLIPMRFTTNVVSLSNFTPGPFQITVGLCPK
jgi:hypothetical protein